MYGIDSEFITSNFIKYCKINTRSDNNSNSIPTTEGQVQLAKILEHVKRWDALVKAEKQFMDDQATIPLFQAAKSQLLNKNVKGITYNPAGVPYDFKNAYFKK